MSDATLLLSTGTTETGHWLRVNKTGPVSIQIVETGTGTVTSTVVVEVSNDGVNAAPSPLWTATINAASPAGDSYSINCAYAWIRAKTTAISASSLVKVYIGA